MACRLRQLLTPGSAAAALSRWELQGLPSLLSLLREWLGVSGGARPRGKIPGGTSWAAESSWAELGGGRVA